MARLGELLVAAGRLTVKQVEQALRAQVVWGGRLGTNLIELHYLELDPLSRVLGQQHQLPAALARHFEKADPELQRRLSPEVAERFSCVPLLRMGPGRHVVIASLAPLPPKHLAIIAGELGVDVKRLVPAIAAELRIRYQLERVYRIRRAARYLRARGKTIPPFPDFQVLPLPSEPDLDPSHPARLAPPALPISTQEMAVFRPPPEASIPREPSAVPASVLPSGDVTERSVAPLHAPPEPPRPDESPLEGDDTFDDLIPVAAGARTATADLDDLTRHDTLDDLAIPVESIEDEVTARQRRKYVRTIADAPPSDSERQTLLGKIAIRKAAVGSTPRIVAGATLGEATRAIRRSTDRDRVADLVIDALERFAPTCEAAIMLVVRGATAIGWRGFQRGGNPLGEIAVPMEDGGLVPRTIEQNTTLRKPRAELDPIDQLLLASLGRSIGEARSRGVGPPTALPARRGNSPVGSTGELAIVPISIADKVICVIAMATADHAPLASAEAVAEAAGAAFARLIRDASR